jgi:hypothetical protein
MISSSLGLSIRRTSVAVTTLLVVAWLASEFGTVATGLAPLLAVAPSHRRWVVSATASRTSPLTR